MENKLIVMISSDLDYEYLIAEIYSNDILVAIVNQEQGSNNMELDLCVITKIKCDAFLGALVFIKNRFSTVSESDTESEKEDIDSLNKRGADLLEEIISSPKPRIERNRFGGIDIFDETNRGARLNGDGSFRGFLEFQEINFVGEKGLTNSFSQD